MQKTSIILVGAGGHARSCIEVLESAGCYEIMGLVERSGAETEEVLGYPVIGRDEDLARLVETHRNALVAIGQIRDPEPRRRTYLRLRELGASLPAVVASSAVVSRHSRIGAGSIIMHGAIINAGAQVGENCIVNSRALVEHDAVIGDHCHISTGALVNGGARIGEGCFIGSGAMLRDGIEVGHHSVIGAGCRLLQNCPVRTFLKNTA